MKSDTATFGTDVTVFNDLEPVDGIASVTLVATHENGDGTVDEHLLISTEVGDGIIEQGVEKVFHFDINPVDNILSPPTTVLFIAKNKDDDALAVAEVTVEFKSTFDLLLLHYFPFVLLSGYFKAIRPDYSQPPYTK